MTVGSGQAAYLQMYENANDGWKATLNGKTLIPLRIDGWQQAWLIPAGAGGTVELEYEPVLLYDIGMIGGAVAVALLAALALVRRRSATPAAAMTPPEPGWVLGLVALTLVVAVVAGPFALIVPALAVVARLRHSLLVPIALVAMVAAGIAAATEAGDPVSAGRGAFGPAAQLLALIALCAAVVTVDRGTRERTSGAVGPDPPPLPQRVRSANGPAGHPDPAPAPLLYPPGSAPIDPKEAPPR